MALVIRAIVLRLFTNFEVRMVFPFGRYDARPVSALVGLPELNLPINFGVSRSFRSRLIGQHLSDASRDL